MADVILKIAVSSATYRIDKPYEYIADGETAAKAKPGCRVLVPFSRGNRVCEGIILALSDSSERGELKSIIKVTDDEPVLTAEQLQLALFMRERFFCTVYEAIKAMLPAGLWLTQSGKTRVRDKTIEIAVLSVGSDEAIELSAEKRRKAPHQADILSELADFGELPARELLEFTSAPRTSLKALENEGLIELRKREIFRRPSFKSGERSELPQLNEEQNSVYEGLMKKLSSGKSSVSLLQGVTGSGKTSVYIRLIDSVLRAGKDAVLLVPEIALTPQMMFTFSSYFGDNIAVLHSNLSPGERYDEWKRVKGGKAHLVIGTRSAVFSPVNNPGIFIIDEEQEESYKSESSPRYNAAEIAMYRCYKAGCPLVLGSATPSLQSRYNAEIGKYSLFRLDRRYNEQQLPEVSIVDMRRELRSGNIGNISSYLKSELAKNIEAGEQSILFLNRRGSNKLISCGNCGFVYQCPNCSVSLTYHGVGNRLMCHYCGYTRKPDSACPDCGAPLKYIGAGTQLIEEELGQLFPGTEIIRADTDVIAAGSSHEQLFEKFRLQNIPIMIGTQMVTKGLNFSNVTLVGVISADQSLYSGDYRASEKTFSLITQVVGRSGRGEKAGRAVIQTFTPDNEVLIQASRQDYDAFYESELEIRKLQNAPPVSNLMAVTVSGLSEASVIEACRYVRLRLEFLSKEINNIHFLGPVPLGIVRMNNRFRYRVYIRCIADSKIREILSTTVIECCSDKRFRGLSFYADSDPSD